MVTALLSALNHMQAALDVLDESGAPPELGARLDTAICRTREVLQQIELQADSEERAIAE